MNSCIESDIEFQQEMSVGEMSVASGVVYNFIWCRLGIQYFLCVGFLKEEWKIAVPLQILFPHLLLIVIISMKDADWRNNANRK